MNKLTHRRMLMKLGAAAFVASVVKHPAVQSQEATAEVVEHQHQPVRPMPECTVAITDTDLRFPAEVRAGLNRVTFGNQSSGVAHVLTLRLPVDVDRDELMAAMAEENATMPDYLRDQYYPGIPDYPAVGGSSIGFVNYEPGSYIAFNIFGSQAPAFFDAVGDSWGVSPPMADHEVGMVEMQFLGLDEPVEAGSQVWSLVNYGATWHEILMMSMPAIMTPDELLEVFMASEPGADMTEAGYSEVGASGIISPGVQVLLEFDLKPGAYAALCFAPDDFSGPPHALTGMVSTFEVN